MIDSWADHMGHDMNRHISEMVRHADAKTSPPSDDEPAPGWGRSFPVRQQTDVVALSSLVSEYFDGGA